MNLFRGNIHFPSQQSNVTVINMYADIVIGEVACNRGRVLKIT